MKGSVIKRMYAGFALIIIMFAVTINHHDEQHESDTQQF